MEGTFTRDGFEILKWDSVQEGITYQAVWMRKWGIPYMAMMVNKTFSYVII